MSSAPQIYETEYYERLFRVEESHWWPVGMRRIGERILDEVLRGRGPLDVLDAGCGSGGTTIWLRRYAGRDVVGSDINRDSIRLTLARGIQKLALASVLDLPYRDRSFDLILLNDVIQHLPGPGADRRALAEMRRVLRPRGVLFMRTNARRPGDTEFAEHDYHRYTADELRERIATAGMRMVKLTRVNFAPSLVGDAKELPGKLLRRVKPAGGHGHEHHQHNPGLQLEEPQGLRRLVSRALLAYLDLEGRFLARPGAALPYGHSHIVVAERED